MTALPVHLNTSQYTVIRLFDLPLASRHIPLDTLVCSVVLIYLEMLNMQWPR